MGERMSKTMAVGRRRRLSAGRTVAGAIAAIGAVVSAVSCGYALAGRGNTLPPHIRIIAVPQFVNETPEPELDTRLTDAVRRELQSRGRFTITQEPAGAHAVLNVTIKDHTVRGIAFTAGQVSRYQITVVADVQFRDQTKNEVLDGSNPALSVSEEYDLGGGTAPADLAALFRQDRNAIERLSQTFANRVVAAILEAF
jgi:outer membrane lipopolysaccharide assembly protein LptE/RlpB